ncbi:hypothetical protein [Methylosinus sp. PW1]|uniref:hypothetical protein n=1 Tax=Methylosinus sp. PW1 TaxID=107636 RepID=UPI0012EB0B21|nr:hypothetical protein [Methylosinus sp. PW1]
MTAPSKSFLKSSIPITFESSQGASEPAPKKAEAKNPAAPLDVRTGMTQDSNVAADHQSRRVIVLAIEAAPSMAFFFLRC